MRRIQIRMLAISNSLLKITCAPASFPRTSFSVSAHPECGRAGKCSLGSNTSAVCSDKCHLTLTCSLSCTGGHATLRLLSDLYFRKLEGDKEAHTKALWIAPLKSLSHHCHQLSPSYHNFFLPGWLQGLLPALSTLKLLPPSPNHTVARIIFSSTNLNISPTTTMTTTTTN